MEAHQIEVVAEAVAVVAAAEEVEVVAAVAFNLLEAAETCSADHPDQARLPDTDHHVVALPMAGHIEVVEGAVISRCLVRTVSASTTRP